ncbi:MAG: DUF1932 domain-containing protein [Pseudomonadota bacterium]
MNNKLRIGLLGFGEVGQIIGLDLRSTIDPALAFDLQFSNAGSSPSGALKENEKVLRCPKPIELGRSCDLIVSAVTAENTEVAARSVAGDLKPNSWFLDLNSASPDTKARTANLINQSGGRYVEGAVMSPVPTKRMASPILIGGPYASAFVSIGQSVGFDDLSVFSDEYGKASAAKMCRSVMIKGIEALVSESLIAARAYGVEDTVLSSLEDLLPGPDWRDLSQYMIERTLVHGGRRAEEMREVANTVSATGLSADMSLATIARQDWAKAYPELERLPSLEALLDALVEIAAPRNKDNAA